MLHSLSIPILYGPVAAGAPGSFNASNVLQTGAGIGASLLGQVVIL